MAYNEVRKEKFVMAVNEYQQSVGEPLKDFTTGTFPDVKVLEGRVARLEHLDIAKHFEAIFDFCVTNGEPRDWTYLPVGPFETKMEVRQWLEQLAMINNAYIFVIYDKNVNKVQGLFSLMSINPSVRTIEMGYVIYSPSLQKSIVATEAQYLAMQYVFEVLEYRRYEWRCDKLNERSNRAALRLGFSFEGTFRQATVYKGRTRDTNWYSILDKEWERQKQQFQNWLSISNFDADGHQIKSLKEC